MLLEGADEAIALMPPEEFTGAIGAHYEEFEQVGHKEVITLLEKSRLGENKASGPVSARFYKYGMRA